MKINKLDYVCTEAFTYHELKILEGLMVQQGHEVDETIDVIIMQSWKT